MNMQVLVTIASLLFLVTLHELGHFFAARKFGVRVEEFGFGIPPRLFAIKLGETIYSINLLLLGAFVRLRGEEKKVDDEESFSTKPLWQRMIIVSAGVVAFWVMTSIIFTFLGASKGIFMSVEDNLREGILNPQVQVVGVAHNSPAENAGLRLGDVILEIQNRRSKKYVQPTTVKEVQEFTEVNKGEEIVLKIQRGKDLLDFKLTPRPHPPLGEGPLGVALSRTAQVKYPWYQAPLQGVLLTLKLTFQIIKDLWNLALDIFSGKGVPEGVDLAGPIGVFQLLNNAFTFGISPFLSFLAVLSCYLAIFNLLPFPVTDGGKLFFLTLEFLRKKPLPEKLEQRITAVSFGILIALFLWVTIRDITRLF